MHLIVLESIWPTISMLDSFLVRYVWRTLPVSSSELAPSEMALFVAKASLLCVTSCERVAACSPPVSCCSFELILRVGCQRASQPGLSILAEMCGGGHQRTGAGDGELSHPSLRPSSDDAYLTNGLPFARSGRKRCARPTRLLDTVVG